jgi:hypothetical protein
MNTLKILALGGISMLTMSNSCSKNTVGQDPCPDKTVTITPLKAFDSFSPSCFGVALSSVGQSKQYIVQSEGEYASLFTCAPAPAIDFSTYTLLVGKIKTASSRVVASQQVQLTCSGEYKYVVKLAEGVSQAVTETLYYALVPKLPISAKITFEVQ